MKLFSTGYIERVEKRKVCGIDLDDVLSNSIPQWIKFVNDFDYKSEEFVRIAGSVSSESIRNYADWARRDHWHLIQMKKEIPYYYYRILKELYRESDVKKNLPCNEGAVWLTEFLKELGFYIVILTARSDRSLKITVDWLNKNKICYDGVIFDENKHVRVIEMFPNLGFMIEDHRGIANMVAKWGYKVFLINSYYNQGKIHENVERIEVVPPLVGIMKRVRDIYGRKNDQA